MNRGIRTERGSTLLIALIMLVLITLLAVSSFSTTNMNLLVVGNMQTRTEALHATQQAIETVISTPQFIASPANAVPNPCGPANTLCSDVTGDGTPEYTTVLNPAPACVAVKTINASELKLNNLEDLACAAGQAQQFGVAGVPSGDSLCANSVWDVTAETRGTVNRTRVTVTQGVSVRISTDDVTIKCP